MKEQGFPESYKPKLRQLHKQHPKWIFKAQKLGIDWYEALNEELVLGRNLVHLDSLDSWKSMEKGAYNFTRGTIERTGRILLGSCIQADYKLLYGSEKFS